ncbi:cytochrome c-type biogenesis protein [Novosphingobium sp.]|uniref:cytochrome c-type biogenesis protein n=1 Tax=Novosphingobium sp. TaxID=1874826 RepID=UPI0025CE00E1|nr:cytochrome c-type biogenesis protein [Novosphingobium sp.]MCC6926823.1 cytochrome c-type biogenesis protein CcmH [Novosphingobium sp.]
MKPSALLAAVALALAAPAFAQDLAEISLADPRQEAQAVALMDSIRCVVCQGQPVSGSNASLAGDMRRLIRERIAAGDKPEDVRAMLVSKYGDWVSFKPVVKPATLPLWIVPLLALLGGVWLVSRRVRLGRG